jgi:hypothetical protein
MAIHANVHNAFEIAKDNAVSHIELKVSTSRWSSRKRNIVTRAITHGVAICGYDTGRFVNDLLSPYGLKTECINTWSSSIAAGYINPDLLEELYAYTAALLKMSGDVSGKGGGYNRGWSFLNDLDKGNKPNYIPLPEGLNKREQEEFLKKYARKIVGAEKKKREELVNLITNGQVMTITYET